MIHEFPLELEQFMEQELVSGKYASREQLVVDAIRLLRERERCVRGLRDEILPALERLDRGEGELLDAEEIKTRGLKRLAQQGRVP